MVLHAAHRLAFNESFRIFKFGGLATGTSLSFAWGPDDPFPPPSLNHRRRRRHFPRPSLQKTFRSSSKFQPAAC